MHLQRFRSLALCAAVLGGLLPGLSGCGESDKVAGSTAASETTNGLQARVTDSDGRPVGALAVTIWPIHSWSDSSRSVEPFRTDAVGLVQLSQIDSGEYRVEVVGESTGVSFPLLVVPDGKLQFQEIRVRPLARVRGQVLLPDGIARVWVQIQGSANGVWSDSTGRFEIPVAVGLAPIVIRAVSIQDSLPLGQDTLLLAPGEIRDLGVLRDPFRVGSLTFGPEAGVYENPVMFSISSKVPGVRIHYTLNGTEPTAASPVFSGVLDIQKSTLIRAWGVKPGLRPSPQESAWVRIRVRPVEFHPLSGTPLTVWIASTTNGARVHCTVDGTMPTENSPRCDTLRVLKTATVKAIGVMDGLENSRVDSAWFQAL
jgi:hypothetical protein